MKDSHINATWPIVLTDDRFDFHTARPEWESTRLADCAERMTEGMVVYDLGAECGDFTSLYRQWVGPTGTVIPVEPQPRYWPSIRTTWEANGYDHPPAAWYVGFVSDHTDLSPTDDENPEGRLPRGDGWPQCSIGTVIPDVGFRELGGHWNLAPQITLDDLVQQTGYPPDAIVMDIEGSELRALQGATSTLRDHRPLMWVSIHPEPLASDWYNASPVDIHLLMRDAGFDGHFLGLCTEELWLYTPQ